MRRPERARLHGLAAVSSALLVAVAVAAALPGTSSAFTALITNSGDTAASKAVFACADTFAGDARRGRAYFEFALDESADTSTAADSSTAGNTGTYRGAHGKDGDPPIACPADGGGAYRLDGSTSRVSTSRQFDPIMHDFSEEVWFRTTSTGKILGFEATVDDRSNNYDKHLYVDTSGRLVYGIYNGGIQTIRTPTAVNDGTWHYAVATTSSSGSVLYLDGDAVDSNNSFTTAENYRGYWRLGHGNLDGGWPDVPGGDEWFAGSVRFAAAYPFVLSAAEVRSAWSIGRPGSPASPAPSPSATASATPAASDSTAPSTSASAAPSASASAVPVSSTRATASPAPYETAQPVTGGSS